MAYTWVGYNTWHAKAVYLCSALTLSADQNCKRTASTADLSVVMMDALLAACGLAKCDYKFVLNLNQCKVAVTVRGPPEAECTTFAFECEYCS